MKDMTSRQRIDAALNHEPTDRVPIDMGGSRITGIASLAYKRLLSHLGMEEPIRLYDIKQQLALPSLDVVNRLGGDVVLVNRLAPTTGMPFLCIDQWRARNNLSHRRTGQQLDVIGDVEDAGSRALQVAVGP